MSNIIQNSPIKVKRNAPVITGNLREEKYLSELGPDNNDAAIIAKGVKTAYI